MKIINEPPPHAELRLIDPRTATDIHKNSILLSEKFVPLPQEGSGTIVYHQVRIYLNLAQKSPAADIHQLVARVLIEGEKVKNTGSQIETLIYSALKAGQESGIAGMEIEVDTDIGFELSAKLPKMIDTSFKLKVGSQKTITIKARFKDA